MGIPFDWLFDNLPADSELWMALIGARVSFKHRQTETIKNVVVRLASLGPLVYLESGHTYQLKALRTFEAMEVSILDEHLEKFGAYLPRTIEHEIKLEFLDGDHEEQSEDLKDEIENQAEHLKEAILIANRAIDLCKQAENEFSQISKNLKIVIGSTKSLPPFFEYSKISPYTQKENQLSSVKFYDISSSLSNLSDSLQFMKSIYETMVRIDGLANSTAIKLKTIQSCSEQVRNIYGVRNDLNIAPLNKMNSIESESIVALDTMWKQVGIYVSYYNKNSELFIERLNSFSEISIRELSKGFWSEK
jgi:hypothetical protein